MAEPAEDFIARQKALAGKKTYAADIGRAGTYVWVREAVTLRVQSNYPEKVFMIERLRLKEQQGHRLRQEGAQLEDVEYRFAYYIVSRADRWHWGQYSPFIPKDDLWPLIQQAVAEKTILR